MIDFTAVKNGNISFEAFADQQTISDLRHHTNDMIDHMLNLIKDCQDVDVTFVPDDPDANDTFAATESDTNLAWTLGHVIVHTTASAEESAALAAERARGVTLHGRSRSELPWQTITTVAQCRHRLEESRRMRLASLEMWPDIPNLDKFDQSHENAPKMNAKGRFIAGLQHDASHVDQIAKIVRQAKAARTS